MDGIFELEESDQISEDGELDLNLLDQPKELLLKPGQCSQQLLSLSFSTYYYQSQYPAHLT